MNTAELVHIPLMSAHLCQDCNSIGNSSTRCPACGSSALMCMSAVMNRPEVVKPELCEVQP